MRTWHAKTMWMFDVDVFLRWGKQHSAVRWMFGEQPNAIHQMSVLQKKFAYDTFRCRHHFFFTFGNDRFPGEDRFPQVFCSSPPLPPPIRSSYISPVIIVIVRALHNFFSGDLSTDVKKMLRIAWEQGLFAASTNAKQCTNLPIWTYASFSHAAFTFAFCLRSDVNPALHFLQTDLCPLNGKVLRIWSQLLFDLLCAHLLAIWGSVVHILFSFPFLHEWFSWLYHGTKDYIQLP